VSKPSNLVAGGSQGYHCGMGLRDRLKKGVAGVVNRLSGEHSSAAPDEIKPMDRPAAPDPDAKIQWAKLNRPKDSGSSG
jgi:hypothetical protein